MKKHNESQESIKAFNSYLVESTDESWKQHNANRKANKTWLKKSAKIAIKINRFLKENKVSQKEMAEKMDVSPQQVNKILKGSENLKLETICKLEEVLGLELISILKSDEVIVKKASSVKQFTQAKVISKEFLTKQVTSPSFKGCVLNFQENKATVSMTAENSSEYIVLNKRKVKYANN